MILASVAVAVGLVACTVLLDRNAPQCKHDEDCVRFGHYPTCSNGVCVPSGLGPPDCFLGTPQKPEEFPKVCTPSVCMPAPDCFKDGTCSDPDGGLVPPTAPPAGAPADAGAPPDGGGAQLPSCVDPVDRPQVIYITGSSNFPPLLAKLGPLIAKKTGYTPVYQVTSSCTGVKSMFSATAKDHFIADPAPGSKTAAATYVTPEGTLVPCALGSTGSGGVRVDIGESDIYATSCPASGAPNAFVGEYYGPIQAMLFVVPGTSTQKVISAAMARTVFGRGGDGISAPWTNPDLYLVRNANTGTQQMMGRAINVPAEQFWGKDQASAKNVAAQMGILASMRGNDSAEHAIGLLSNDFYDVDRGNLSALFFQAPGQLCGFLPDSNAFAKDKRNVRDGHYPIWGPLHFFATLSPDEILISPAAQAFVSVVSALQLDQELLNAYIDSGLVPSCAMRVQRSADLGPLSAFAPPVACACYFENRLNNPNGGGTPPAGCGTCISSADCADPSFPACQFNFCEAAN